MVARIVHPYVKMIPGKEIGVTILAVSMLVSAGGLWYLCVKLGQLAENTNSRTKAVALWGLGMGLVGAGPFYVGLDFYRSFRLGLLSEATYFGVPFLGFLMGLLLAACAINGYARAAGQA